MASPASAHQDSALTRAAAQFRARIIAGEAQAVIPLIEAYKGLYGRTSAQLKQILAEIDREVATGKAPGVARLYERNRLARILGQVGTELEKIGAQAAKITTDQQLALIQQAGRDAKQFSEITLGPKPGGFTGVSWAEVPAAEIESLAGLAGDGSPLKTLLDELAPSGAHRVRNAVIQGVALGRDEREIGAQIQQILGGNMGRALSIVRTEDMRAYRESQRQAFALNSDVIVAVRWFASLSSDTCPACLALHGREFPPDYVMEAHPNCLVGGAVVHGPKALASSARWYEGNVIEFETISGNRLTVTPNHPILTPEGWVNAGSLHEGGYVISSSFAKRPLHRAYPDDYQIPALIENIVESLPGAGAVASITVPVAAVDFHGDGGGSKVCVIRANSLLQRAFNAPLQQPSVQRPLVIRNMGLPLLPRHSPLAQFLKTRLTSPRGILRGHGKGAMLLRRARFRHQPISLNRRATRYSGFDQAILNHRAGYAIRSRQGKLRFTGQIAGDKFRFRQSDTPRRTGCRTSQSVARSAVTHQATGFESVRQSLLTDVEAHSGLLRTLAANVSLDRILKISVRRFSGHVYNLQTLTGWYVANGIVTHNCRCLLVPVTEGSEKFESGETWFERQSGPQKKRILGPDAFVAYQRGQVKLRDFIGHRHNDDWGGMFHTCSLKAVLSAD